MIEECPHCLQKVIMNETGKCPACGTSKFISASKSRDEILYDQDKKEATEKVVYFRKNGPRLIACGILVTLLICGALLLMILNNFVHFYVYFLILIGPAMIRKGYSYKLEKQEVMFRFKEKYNETI